MRTSGLLGAGGGGAFGSANRHVTSDNRLITIFRGADKLHRPFSKFGGFFVWFFYFFANIHVKHANAHAHVHAHAHAHALMHMHMHMHMCM